jgi:hypothetical protein
MKCMSEIVVWFIHWISQFNDEIIGVYFRSLFQSCKAWNSAASASVKRASLIYSAPAIVPAALSYLSFPAASRWTKTFIPKLWLRHTRGIWRGRRICHRRSDSSSSSGRSSRGGGDSGSLLLQARTNLATVLIEAFAMSLKGLYTVTDHKSGPDE